MDPAKFTPRGARGVSVISIPITFYILAYCELRQNRHGWVDVELVVDWCFVAVAVASPSHMVLRM